MLTKLNVAAIFHPNLTSLTGELCGGTLDNIWASVLKRTAFFGLKTLSLRYSGAKKTLQQAISSLSLFVATSRIKLQVELIHFDAVRNLELNKTLRYFVHLRSLIFLVCDFDDPVSQAIKKCFLSVTPSGVSYVNDLSKNCCKQL